MKYTKLGNTGLDVSRLCLGCMGFGDAENGGFINGYLMKSTVVLLLKKPLSLVSIFLIRPMYIQMEQARKFLDGL